MIQYWWLDNKLILPSKNSVLVDEGFLYGQGLFETMRIYDYRPFLLERHIERLENSCKKLNIVAPPPQLLEKAAKQVIARNKIDSGYLRLNVWKAKNATRIFVFTRRESFYKDSFYKKGFSALLIEDIRINEKSFLTGHKTFNYYFYRHLWEKATKLGKQEAIILNTKGFVCEGSRSNLFIIKNSKVITPPLSSGCLGGITRKVVIEICHNIGITVREDNIKCNELFNCSEAFLTNSLIEVMPLTKINKKLINRARPGEITLLILSEYKKFVQNYLAVN